MKSNNKKFKVEWEKNKRIFILKQKIRRKKRKEMLASRSVIITTTKYGAKNTKTTNINLNSNIDSKSSNHLIIHKKKNNEGNTNHLANGGSTTTTTSLTTNEMEKSSNTCSCSNRSNIIELNNQNRLRLKRSLTYLMSHGYFQNVRTLIQSHMADLNETDQWWLLNPNINLVNKKCLVIRRDRYRILSRLQTSIDLGGPARFGQPIGMAVGRTPLMLSTMIEDDAWAFSIAQVRS